MAGPAWKLCACAFSEAPGHSFRGIGRVNKHPHFRVAAHEEPAFPGRWHVTCYIGSCGLTSQTKKGKIDEHAQYCRANIATPDPVRDVQDRTNAARSARSRRVAGHQPRLFARSLVDAGGAGF